ncbi:MAG: hypothetical protein QF578_00555 [Alphaproteobacteria bacterium]|jgi:hypothetical protein|nr:hypothetical protein [Alphaproteobacteria bacterium]MDP6563294.1 hypothetical protein [Alphaproteobacteria bacterium]MDP6815472.1 hypothetical protein [Alphaproteobacteria bacterium]
MTAITPAPLPYLRVPSGPTEIAAVRPVTRRQHDAPSRQQAILEAARRGRNRQRPANTEAGGQPQVVELAQSQPTAPTAAQPSPRPYVPFLAQQIAQENSPPETETAAAKRRAAALAVYRMASNDNVVILGPVRPREIVV